MDRLYNLLFICLYRRWYSFHNLFLDRDRETIGNSCDRTDQQAGRKIM